MPLFNIFKTKSKQDNQKNPLKPTINADIHEKNSLVLSNLIEKREAEIEVKNLEIGDYLIGNTIIERKTIQDFISSMLSKRLLEQLRQMQQYKKKLLILEGKLDAEGINFNLNPNAIKGMVLSISLDYEIPVIFTKNEKETAEYLILLAKRQLKHPQEISLHSRKPTAKKEKMRYIIESFEGIGPQTAKKLLKKFKTIKNIINAEKAEIEKEIGKKSEIFSLVDEEF